MAGRGGKQVELSDIGAELNAVQQPSAMAVQEERQLELEHARENNRHDAEKENRKLGVLGRFFGTRDNAIVYVVAILFLVCAVCVGGLSYIDATLRPNAFEFFRMVGIALVGFFAGRAVSNKDE
jgi:hypothetical protein